MKVEQLSLFDMPVKRSKKAVCLSVGNFAKVLSSKGFNIGLIKLFDKLRTWGLINKFNVPYQKYIDDDWFKVIKEEYKKGGKYFSVYLKILVTPIGQRKIEERLRNEANDNRS